MAVRRSLLWLVVAAFVGATFISWLGNQQEWGLLTTFLVTTGFLGVLAVVRRGITRPIMVILIFVQAIPVFGIGTVARLAPVATVIGLTVMWRLYVAKLSRSTLIPSADLEVDPGAQGFVDHLLHLGFQVVGAADARGPGYSTVFTYLVSSDRRSFAVATDRVETLASLFGERILVTIDRASLPVPPLELRQLVPSDLPELYDAHKQALAVIRQQGHQPDHLIPGRIVGRALRHEQNSIEFLGARPWWVAGQVALGVIRRRPPDAERITESVESASRIARWAASG